jgi:hypothetical protein
MIKLNRDAAIFWTHEKYRLFLRKDAITGERGARSTPRLLFPVDSIDTAFLSNVFPDTGRASSCSISRRQDRCQIIKGCAMTHRLQSRPNGTRELVAGKIIRSSGVQIEVKSVCSSARALLFSEFKNELAGRISRQPGLGLK